ncbi:CBS domain-containing protein ykuL [Mycobacteroides abscessus subsp. abscessus]|nr:CBS domain-containing protein ykuL [Mycobacteroides abscessus subsp. abscessus]
MKLAIELLVDHPFVCVENDDGFFEGILTRRALLDRLNKHVRRLNRK